MNHDKIMKRPNWIGKFTALYSNRLSMAVYKYLDGSGKVEYKDTGMMLAIQGSLDQRVCVAFWEYIGH